MAEAASPLPPLPDPPPPQAARVSGAKVAIAATASVDHLWDLGHRRIALVSGSQEVPGFEHYGPYVRIEQSYRRMASERGIEPVVLYATQSARSGREVAAELSRVAAGVTGVIIVTETAAAGMVAELHRLGRSVPEQISVVSVTSSADMAQVSDPPLTVVTAPGVELGRLGVQALVRRLEGRDPLPPQLRVGTLEVGASTAPPPGLPLRPSAGTKARLGKTAEARRTS